ncbi:hypothetical protein BOX15_Mlig020692g1 [Macrostomum lignano]|uniref:Calponin-homology (CH) domain-containing protein n=1 Tax=Macrostomum lignano TaxID=282301 RepID=A0A267DQ98_9PLAT|nr:hypothetical protein BOX15_Mlig020692g1 [Macrostomum lignano]
MSTTMAINQHNNDKAIEKVFADAEKNGCLKLSKKKLKLLPATIGGFNLFDLLHVDLSNNRFTEFPKHLCSCQFVQCIDCSHNSIWSIPDTFRLLHNLQQLDLSYNCLTQFPSIICELRSLQILILNSNKLVELPHELGGLTELVQLEASNNALQTVSPRLSSIDKLRVLKLHNNKLITVPSEWSTLKLTCLDLSGNRLQQLPHDYRLLHDTLQELCLDLNPMLSPPATVCARGLRHVMKYLTVESIREGQTLGKSASRADKQIYRHLQHQQQQLNGLAAAQNQSGDANSLSSSSASYLRRLRVSASPPKSALATPESASVTPLQQQPPPTTTSLSHRPGSGGRGQVQFIGSSSSVVERLQLQSSRLGSSVNAGVSSGGGGSVVKSLSFSSALSSHAEAPSSNESQQRRGPMSHSPSAYQIGSIQEQQQQPKDRGVGDAASSRLPPGSRFGSSAAAGSTQVDTQLIGQMKSILERRLSLALPDTPDGLTEALRDGVLLCCLANQMAPGSIPRVHVPPQGVAELPLPKSRRNIENFLALCRRIGLPGSQSFLVTDLMSGPRGLQRVAKTVLGLEELTQSQLSPRS